MAHTNNEGNLIPHRIKTAEEARVKGRNGGLRSVEVRRGRKTFREQLKAMLSCDIPKESPLYRKMAAQMKALGFKGDPKVQDITLIGMLMRSAKDNRAAEFIRDTIGEKPTEVFEDATPQSPIILEMPSAEEVEAIRARREARNAEDERRMNGGGGGAEGSARQ